MAKVRTVEVEISAQIEDYARAIKDNQQKVRHWTDKLRTLRDAAAQQARELQAAGAHAGEEAAEGAEGAEAAPEAPALAELSAEQLEACDSVELQVRRPSLCTLTSSPLPAAPAAPRRMSQLARLRTAGLPPHNHHPAPRPPVGGRRRSRSWRRPSAR